MNNTSEGMTLKSIQHNHKKRQIHEQKMEKSSHNHAEHWITLLHVLVKVNNDSTLTAGYPVTMFQHKYYKTSFQLMSDCHWWKNDD